MTKDEIIDELDYQVQKISWYINELELCPKDYSIRDIIEDLAKIKNDVLAIKEGI